MLGDYYVIRPQKAGPLAGNLVPDQRTCTSSAPQAKPVIWRVITCNASAPQARHLQTSSAPQARHSKAQDGSPGQSSHSNWSPVRGGTDRFYPHLRPNSHI